MYLIQNLLFELSNGNFLRVNDMVDDDEFAYGYDYFDGETKRVIDSGVFNLPEGLEETEDNIVEEAMRRRDLNPEVIGRSLIQENVEYSDLEEMGFSGF